ncbi:hypothetical protein BH18ACT15_BH18ACT15_07210 [soil metagenome]
MLLAAAVFTLGGWLLKAQCTAPWAGYHQYESLCYNDIQALYVARGVDLHTFPYVHGGLSPAGLTGGAIEYPVLTGLFMWASGLLASDLNGYLVISALLLAPWALFVSWLLARMAGWRALMWAAAPSLVLYAFHNWDLLAVACAVAGLYAWWRGAPVWAGVLFGLGGAFKLYPAIFLLPLAADCLVSSDGRKTFRALAAGTGVMAAANLPFALKNFGGWSATYRFHSLRGADFNSLWHWVAPDLSVGALNTLSTALTAAFWAAALGFGYTRARRDGTYPFLGVCAALLASLLLWTKVHSPQYALWLLPFFVLLRVRVSWWVLYSLADLAVYVGIFRWFYDLSARGLDATLAKDLLVAGVGARALLLALLFVVFLRAPTGTGEERPAPQSVSQAPARLARAGP